MKLLCCIFAGLFSFSSYATDIQTFKFTFDPNDHFTVAFADYPKGSEAMYELKSEVNTALPSDIHSKARALKISGINHSDDLFMYAYKKLSGLKPNTEYQIRFSLEFASNALAGSSGIGGAPGDSVYVKVGALSKKPSRFVDASGLYQVSWDKGNQMSDGSDMITIGHVGVETHDAKYRVKTVPFNPDPEMLNKIENFSVRSNEAGEIWVLFGTDSGYEGESDVYYTGFVVGLREIDKTV